MLIGQGGKYHVRWESDIMLRTISYVGINPGCGSVYGMMAQVRKKIMET